MFEVYVRSLRLLVSFDRTARRKKRSRNKIYDGKRVINWKTEGSRETSVLLKLTSENDVRTVVAFSNYFHRAALFSETVI